MLSLIQITLSALNKTALTLSINLFGYFLPAISSVRAVIHKDADGYNQWLSYFLILHLFNIILPFLDLALHPWLKVLLILWLSLPKYQGASVVYARILVPALDKYEDHVDVHIEKVQKEGKRRIFTFMSSTGYHLMQKFWNLVQLARDGQLVQNLLQEEDNNQEGNSSGRSKRDPQHSVRGSLRSSSLSDIQDEEYIRDFIQMLTRGLFVFAYVGNSDTVDKQFKLRVFSYEEDDKSLLISHVDNKNHTIDDSILLPIKEICDVRETGAQGICICLDGGVMAEVVLSDKDDRETMLSGLKVCLPVMKQDEDEEQVVDEVKVPRQIRI